MFYGGCDELRVVDAARAIGVQVSHDLLEIIRDLHFVRQHALFQLLDGQRPIPILVHPLKSLLEFLDVRIAELLGDDSKSHFLQFRGTSPSLKLRSEAPHDDGCSRSFGLFLQPAVVQKLRSCRPLDSVESQHLLDEILSFIGNLVPLGGGEVEGALLDAPKDLSIRVAEEGRVAAEKDVADDATAPDVALLIVGACQDFRGHVVRSTGLGRHGWRVGRKGFGQAEVDDLDGGVPVWTLQEEVFRLDIAVREAGLVEVAHGTQDLHHVRGCLVLIEGAAITMSLCLLDDPIEQLPASAKLHDQVDVLGVFEHFIELYNVWVVQQLLDGNLLLHPLLC
mmetsp:Transcript_7403/g.16152  ORF Transcript_7403/g.16152 Transcript_7403/m.16152 type:complete len:337 (+) Transcript_7403:293-1303(+)